MGSVNPESRVTKRIVEAIKKAYPLAFVFKVHGGSMQQAGIPDLLVCVEGLWVGLEVKARRPGESEEYARSRATPRQRAMIEKINRSGGLAAVVLTPEESLDAIERAFIKQDQLRAERLAQTEGEAPQ